MYGISACGIVNEKQWYSNRFVESMIVSLFPPPLLPAPSVFLSICPSLTQINNSVYTSEVNNCISVTELRI